MNKYSFKVDELDHIVNARFVFWRHLQELTTALHASQFNVQDKHTQAVFLTEVETQLRDLLSQTIAFHDDMDT